MLSYCVKCRKNTGKNSWVAKKKKKKPEEWYFFQNFQCVIIMMNKSTFESDCFLMFYFALRYKVNEIINKVLLAGDKFMPEMHLRQPGFTYSGCGLID